MGLSASRVLDLEWAFQYLSVADLRASGVSISEHPEDYDAWLLGQRIARHINMVTEQLFNPVYLDASVDGAADRLIPSPHSLPIIQVDSLRLEPGGISVETSVYSVQDRCIQLRSRLGRWTGDSASTGHLTDDRLARTFPSEVDTATILGWFGWIEGRIPRRAAARTGGTKYLKLLVGVAGAAANALPATAKGVAIPVDSTVGVKVGQTVAARLVAVDDYIGLGLVTEVVAGVSITVDYLEEDLLQDDEIFIFPGVPHGIVQASKILAGIAGHGMGEPIPGISSPGSLPVGFAINEERVDNYRWKATTSGRAGDQAGTGQRSTGVPAADALLQFYTRPSGSFLV